MRSKVMQTEEMQKRAPFDGLCLRANVAKMEKLGEMNGVLTNGMEFAV